MVRACAILWPAPTRRLTNGVRALVVQDPEAVFAACCVNVQCGYFDDPEDLPGLAHFLEHAGEHAAHRPLPYPPLHPPLRKHTLPRD